MATRTMSAGPWTPTHDTVAGIGAVLCAHWAAAKAAAKDQFWRKPANWLDVSRETLNRITTSR